MSKITLTAISNLDGNPTSAQTNINNNFTLLQTAIDNTLSRDGSTPNQMNASLDMNSNRIINLPAPVGNNDAARLIDVGNAPSYAAAAAASAASASASATAAASSAVSALNYVSGLSGTSSSSVAIATGSKSFTASTGKLWSAGQFVTLASNANSANYMHGTVTSYNSVSGALVVNVLDVGGSGTFADWNIAITGTQGPTGPAGALGVSGTPSAGQFGIWTNSTTQKGVSITGLVKGNGASDPTAAVAGTDFLLPSNNLSDVTTPATARTNLGLGTAATQNTNTSGANVPLLNGKNTWTNVQSPTVSALTSGSGADFSTSQVWTANVNGGTFTISNPSTNPPTGSFIGISVTFTTANSLAFGTNFKTTGYTSSTSGKDFLTFYWNGTTYELVGVRNATNS